MKNNKGFILESLVIALGITAIGSLIVGTIALKQTEKSIEQQIQQAKNPQTNPQTFGSSFTPAQAQKLTLSGSGVSAAATTVGLQTMHTPDGRDITMAMLGDIGYGTLEPGTSREESISFKGITQNADDTAALTGVSRGLDFVTPYADSTTLQKAHAGGSIFILTNTSAFYGQQFAFLDSDASITQKWAFPTSTTLAPGYNGGVNLSGLATSTFAHIDYVNSVATSGVADASQTVAGKVEEATCAELASSTPSGGVARLFSGGACHSSTSSLANVVPVVGANNKLSQSFLNLAEDWNVTGGLRSSSSTTSGTLTS